jgi:hypothetical protein
VNEKSSRSCLTPSRTAAHPTATTERILSLRQPLQPAASRATVRRYCSVFWVPREIDGAVMHPLGDSDEGRLKRGVRGVQ